MWNLGDDQSHDAESQSLLHDGVQVPAETVAALTVPGSRGNSRRSRHLVDSNTGNESNFLPLPGTTVSSSGSVQRRPRPTALDTTVTIPSSVTLAPPQGEPVRDVFLRWAYTFSLVFPEVELLVEHFSPADFANWMNQLPGYGRIALPALAILAAPTLLTCMEWTVSCYRKRSVESKVGEIHPRMPVVDELMPTFNRLFVTLASRPEAVVYIIMALTALTVRAMACEFFDTNDVCTALNLFYLNPNVFISTAAIFLGVPLAAKVVHTGLRGVQALFNGCQRMSESCSESSVDADRDEAVALGAR